MGCNASCLTQLFLHTGAKLPGYSPSSLITGFVVYNGDLKAYYSPIRYGVMVFLRPVPWPTVDTRIVSPLSAELQ